MRPALNWSWSSRCRFPAVVTAEPAASPHQRRATAAHAQVTNPLRPPVPHPDSSGNPQWGHLDHPRVDSTSTSRRSTEFDQYPQHPNTRQVQANRHNIRHRGLLASASCYFADASEASPPFQGFHPTQPAMLLCFANRLLGEPVLVSGSEVVVVVEASFEL